MRTVSAVSHCLFHGCNSTVIDLQRYLTRSRSTHPTGRSISLTIEVQTLIQKRTQKDFRLENASMICPIVYGQFCALNEASQGLGPELSLDSVHTIGELQKLAGTSSHPSLYRARNVKEEKSVDGKELWTYVIEPSGQGKSSSWHYGWKSSRFMRDTLHCECLDWREP